MTQVDKAPLSKVSLSEHLPLLMPLSLMVDPSNRCNFKCTFCPTGDESLLRSVGRPKGDMPFELFQKIIDDLVDLEMESGSILSKLLLYKDGEPLLNKRLGEMIRYAKGRNVAESIETTTNGVLLTPKKVSELLEAGLDQIRISVEHVNDSGYKMATQTFSNYERVRNNVAHLYAEKSRTNNPIKIYVKIIDLPLTDPEKQLFVDEFSEISDFLTIDPIMGWSKSEAKDFTLGNSDQVEIERVNVCPRPFYTLSVNFNGAVSVCCVDWSWGTVVGDLSTTHLRDIWNGNSLRMFRVQHLKGRRSEIPVCENCHYLDSKTEECLDNHSTRLLEVFS